MKNNNNILKNIKESDLGFSVPKDYFNEFEINFKKQAQSGFKVPDTYFDNLEDKIFNKLNSTKIPKKSGFTTPDNYFNKLHIDDKLEKDSPKVIRLFSSKSIKIASMAIAASFILFLGIRQFSKSQDPINFDNISMIEIENWIDNDMIVFNTSDITETYTDLEIESDLHFNENEISEYLTDKDLEQLILEN